MIKSDSVTILFYNTLPVCEGSEKRTVGRCATIMNKPRVGRIQYLITKFYEIKLQFAASHGKTSYFGMFLLNFIYTCIFCFLSAYIVAKDLYLCVKQFSKNSSNILFSWTRPSKNSQLFYHTFTLQQNNTLQQSNKSIGFICNTDVAFEVFDITYFYLALKALDIGLLS